jgi:N-acetylglucosamine-6-phosphate deacetylase
MKYAVTNCDIHTGEEVLYDKAIVIKDDYIHEIIDLDKIPKDLEVLDLNGANIAPGFIDLQVNGGGGCLFNDNPSVESISTIFQGHKRFGTTNFLPTIITTTDEKIYKAIKSVKECLKNKTNGVLGLHIEGPFINEKKAGVHDKKFIHLISESDLDFIRKNSHGSIKIITLSPELVTENQIKSLKECGIIISAGHSSATYDQSIESFKWGITNVTHLFNAMSSFESREPGLVGATLDIDSIWAGIIVDGYHVNFASVRIAKKIKKNKLFLVTDAMPPVGSNISDYKLGDLKIQCNNKKCVTMDGVLAGSALDMATAVRNCVQKVGIPLDEALRMASTYPSETIGINNTLGKIKPGFLANMVIFNNQIVVESVIINGVFEKIN